MATTLLVKKGESKSRVRVACKPCSQLPLVVLPLWVSQRRMPVSCLQDLCCYWGSQCGAVVTIPLLFYIPCTAVLYFAALVCASFSSLTPFLAWPQLLLFAWWPVNVVSTLLLFPFVCCLCQSWILPPQGWEQFPWKDSGSSGLRSLELILSNGLFIHPTDDGCACLREVCTVITVATSMVQTTLLIKYRHTCSIVKHFYVNPSENLIRLVQLLTSLQIPSFGVCPSAIFLLWRYSQHLRL